MEGREVKPEQIWRHFKGGIYRIAKVQDFYAEKFKDGDLIFEYDAKRWYAASDIWQGDTVVEYESTSDSTKGFIRSRKSFLETLPDGTPRFTRCRD